MAKAAKKAKKMRLTPHTLVDLRNIVLTEFKMKAKDFDGIYLTYPKVKFSLVTPQPFDEGGWVVYKKKEVYTLSLSELKENIENLLKKP